jgi:hypothetical protein
MKLSAKAKALIKRDKKTYSMRLRGYLYRDGLVLVEHKDMRKDGLTLYWDVNHVFPFVNPIRIDGESLGGPVTRVYFENTSLLLNGIDSVRVTVGGSQNTDERKINIVNIHLYIPDGMEFRVMQLPGLISSDIDPQPKGAGRGSVFEYEEGPDYHDDSATIFYPALED